MSIIELTKIKTKLDSNSKVKPIHLVSNFDNTFTARFSNLFQPLGHSFTTSFDVLKTAYWLKYEIITAFDCLVYDTIHLFCKTKTPFSLSVLADKMNVGDGTLRDSLDNLENAELIEIIKVTDEYGQHNCYLLKTPLFERESIEFQKNVPPYINENIRNRRNQFKANGLPIPTEFLDDHADRLRRKVRKNKAKRYRELIRSQLFAEKHPLFFERLKLSKKDRFLLWKQVSRTFNENAATFDEFMYSITPELARLETNGGLWAKLREKVKEWCKRLAVKYDDYWFPEIAKKLFDFYRSRLRKPQTPAKAATNNSYDDLDKPDTKSQLRQILKSKQEKGILPETPEGLKDFLLRNLYHKALSIEVIIEIIKEFYNQGMIEKITKELRT